MRLRVERQKHMMGFRKILAAGLAGILALPLLTATAQAAEWWIERMSGNVQIHNGVSWVALDEDRALNAGESIWTGRNGRILLMNNQGSVLLAPRSLVKVPAQALPRNFSVLFQTHGTVSAQVDKRRTRHFSVQTPYLAAVVKGTEFDVEIKRKQTRVAVREGLVGVVDIDTGETVDVPAGSEVSTAAKAGSGLFGQAVAASAHSNGKGKGKGGGRSGGGSGQGGGGGGQGGGGGGGGQGGGGGGQGGGGNSGSGGGGDDNDQGDDNDNQ
jgi:hypothetical protein